MKKWFRCQKNKPFLIVFFLLVLGIGSAAPELAPSGLEDLEKELQLNDPTADPLVEKPKTEDGKEPEKSLAADDGETKLDLIMKEEAKDTPPPSLPLSQTKNSKFASQVTSVEFKMEPGGISKIEIRFSEPTTYAESHNETLNQYTYIFNNADVTRRLQRAYDTTEFATPIALFTLLDSQSHKGEKQAKLIVQMRENKVLTVKMKGKLFELVASPTEKFLDAKEDGVLPDEDENIYSTGRTFSGKSIAKLEIKNADIHDVLRLLSKSSGYNIVVGDDVQGKVGTLSLENTPWDQAFALVLQSKKLGYVKQGKVIRVSTLSNLKSEKEEALATEQSRVKIETIKTLLIPISYAKAAELSPRIKPFLTDRGNVDSDNRTNTLIIRDIDRILPKVQKLVSALDVQPPRVSISARIVEMLHSYARNMGVPSLTASQTFSGVNISQSFLSKVGAASSTTISAPAFANLQASFQIGELENKVKTLANPSVTVVANQAASISQSFSFFVPSTEVTASGTVASVRQITANLKLDTTPIVSGDGSIFLTVHLTNDVPQGGKEDRTISSRSVSTQVLLENGDTAVLGGVFTSTINQQTEGIPLLGKIPILGLLVSTSTFEDNKNEIFVFITAKILNPEESLKRVL